MWRTRENISSARFLVRPLAFLCLSISSRTGLVNRITTESKPNSLHGNSSSALHSKNRFVSATRRISILLPGENIFGYTGVETIRRAGRQERSNRFQACLHAISTDNLSEIFSPVGVEMTFSVPISHLTPRGMGHVAPYPAALGGLPPSSSRRCETYRARVLHRAPVQGDKTRACCADGRSAPGPFCRLVRPVGEQRCGADPVRPGCCPPAVARAQGAVGSRAKRVRAAADRSFR